MSDVPTVIEACAATVMAATEPTAPETKNRAETDIKLGGLRMKTLVPYVERQMGLPPSDDAAPVRSLRADMKNLKAKLRCGEDFIRKCARLIRKLGPQNVTASHFLRQAPSSKNSLKIAPALREPLDAAIRYACVDLHLLPGTTVARGKIREHMLTVGGVAADDLPCDETINKRSKRPEVIAARVADIEGEHAVKIMAMAPKCVSAHKAVVLDVTTFTSDEKDKSRVLYALNDRGENLGVVNCYFGLSAGSRDIWTALPFVKAANAMLTGLALHVGLLSKEPIFRELGMSPQLSPCGKPAHFFYDLGKELVNAHVTRIFDELKVLYTGSPPGGLPEYRGHLERFNRMAHRLFDAFLESEQGKEYLVPVPRIPEAKGILFRHLRIAMWRWLLQVYRHKEHKGLGLVSPAERFEDFVYGRRGFPASGYLGGPEDTAEFRWMFLRERARTITHLGIEINGRRYSDPKLAEFFVPGTRSSKVKIPFRDNPFDRSNVIIRLKSNALLPVPYIYDRDKYPMDRALAESVVRCSDWEWDVARKTLRRAAVDKPTEDEINNVLFHRAKEAAGGVAAGAPNNATKQSDRARAALRTEFGKFASQVVPLPSSAPSTAEIGSAAVDDPEIQDQPVVEMLPCLSEAEE